MGSCELCFIFGRKPDCLTMLNGFCRFLSGLEAVGTDSKHIQQFKGLWRYGDLFSLFYLGLGWIIKSSLIEVGQWDNPNFTMAKDRVTKKPWLCYIDKKILCFLAPVSTRNSKEYGIMLLYEKTENYSKFTSTDLHE